MGFFDGAKAALAGRKAYQTHVSANKLVDEGKPAEAKRKYEEALAQYAEAVRLGTTVHTTLQGYAVLLMREGKFEEARELMLRMQKLKDMSADDWFDLRVQFSLYQWKTGQLDKAIETIRRAASHKMSGMIYSTLGMYLVDKARQTGDLAEALAFNQEALDYDDEDAATLDNVAQLYEAMSEADADKAAEYRAKALDFYEKAHEQKPRQITTIYYLARMLHQDGDDDRARKLLSVRDTLYISAICPVTRQMMDDLAAEIQ